MPDRLTLISPSVMLREAIESTEAFLAAVPVEDERMPVTKAEVRLRAAFIRIKRGDAVVWQRPIILPDPLAFVKFDFGCGETVWSSPGEATDIPGPVTIEIVPCDD
jgi:hypothetical protein